MATIRNPANVLVVINRERAGYENDQWRKVVDRCTNAYSSFNERRILIRIKMRY